MANRRRQRACSSGCSDSRRQIPPKKKSVASIWQPAVPSWEKEFCRSVGSMSWDRLLEAKKSVHVFKNVIEWNDSAGKEAFENAKRKFYDRMHGIPPRDDEVSLPDPDLYIDEIDWEAPTDRELLLDFDRKPGVRVSDRRFENVVIFGESFYKDKGFSAGGWGD